MMKAESQPHSLLIPGWIRVVPKGLARFVAARKENSFDSTLYPSRNGPRLERCQPLRQMAGSRVGGDRNARGSGISAKRRCGSDSYAREGRRGEDSRN